MQNITRNEELILSSIVRFENFDMQHIKPILTISTTSIRASNQDAG